MTVFERGYPCSSPTCRKVFLLRGTLYIWYRICESFTCASHARLQQTSESRRSSGGISSTGRIDLAISRPINNFIHHKVPRLAFLGSVNGSGIWVLMSSIRKCLVERKSLSLSSSCLNSSTSISVVLDKSQCKLIRISSFESSRQYAELYGTWLVL